MSAGPEYETLVYELNEHIATVTLNRPDKLNAFNQPMLDEFRDLWHRLGEDDDVHVIVLRAAGDRAFSTGLDVSEGFDQHENIWSRTDPGDSLSPKHNRVWKPVITAVHGMVAGGAFYWLNDSDIVISSENATFFDPHVSYGLVSALEPAGLARRVPLGEALRWALLGLDERMSAERAREIGLVSELLAYERLWERAHELATIIARKPPIAVQGTVKAIWETRDMDRETAQRTAWNYPLAGNPISSAQVSRDNFERPQWTLR